MTAQEILANLSGTLMDDPRILSLPERELLASLLQHTKTHSGARDNAVTEAIARAVGEVIAQRAYGILGSNIAQRLLDESALPGSDVHSIRAHSPRPPAPSPPGPGMPTPPPSPGPDDDVKSPRPSPRGYSAVGPRALQASAGPRSADSAGSREVDGTPGPRGIDFQEDETALRAHSPRPPAPSPPGPGTPPSPRPGSPRPDDDVKSPRPSPRGYDAAGPRSFETPVGPRSVAVQSDAGGVAVLDAPRELRGECVVLEEFLAPAELDELTAYTLASEEKFQLSEIISPDIGGAVDFEYRRSRALQDLGKHGDVIVNRIKAALPRILEQLGHEPFEATRVEAQITASNDGDFFRWHNDNGHGEIATRELTFVYFFHREPRQFQGGELRLYDSRWEGGVYRPQENYRTVVPQQNQAIFFLSSLAHEITPVECPSGAFADSRFTVNGWFHR